MAKNKEEMERKLAIIMTTMIPSKSGETEGSTLTNLIPGGKKVEFSSMEDSKPTPSPSPQPGSSQTVIGAGTPAIGAANKPDLKERSASREGAVTPVRRRSSPAGSLMNEIRKMSLASQDAKEERKLRRFRRFHGRRRKRREEEYTDKDRAAAVTLGSRDIKQSLKAKKKRERKLCVSIDLLNREDFLCEMLLKEAVHQMRIKDIPMALNTLDKALELQPTHKAALVARSKCFLKLGDAELAYKDAATCCESKYNDIMGLFQYAESLYNLGEFEKALISYHRGCRMRKDMDGFRIGVQKCQEAIRKSIGDTSATKIEDLEDILPMIYEQDNFKNQKSDDNETRTVQGGELDLERILLNKFSEGLKPPSRIRSRWVSREVLGQMYFDKDYLVRFLSRPDIRSDRGGVASELKEIAKDALEYLQIREEFWRQQNPIHARKPGFNVNNKMVMEYESKERVKQAELRNKKVSTNKKTKPNTNGPNETVDAGTGIKLNNEIAKRKNNPKIRITPLPK